ncbi:1,2-dihydroxy-3-keto-5-methylthiopentene dioxygenase [Oryzomicrobium terrae]|uniref:acireductone dioxygenase (Fe(2+)-requiring) n=1 Tax=Oryzomicrobium terrae TaxID=1735038 RepID=A0A5C1E608_9RHOO|nr:cupin domain-containing protein [Oryzomicrobium terrae]QEL64095.1 1,2-dihydroxy-3-keto-5-methylthiopentene dioxygenase [Oryzomicrobium terrae]
MARLIHPDGTVVAAPAAVARAVAALGAHLDWRPPPSRILDLLVKPVLAEAEKATVLAAVDVHVAPWVERLVRRGRERGGRAPETDVQSKSQSQSPARDLVVLHDGIANLAALREQFAAPHRHDDDEVRYVVDGVGYFGFVAADGSQVLLEVAAGDYLEVPAGAEHWFALGADPRLKAVRYFLGAPAWEARYTGTSVMPVLKAAPLADLQRA